jgi:non-haem Fe2+, alpha-ketoglutarate-dependent halogenase
MTKLLSEAEVAGYREHGYHFPVNALSAGEVTEFRRKLEDYEAASGGPIKSVRPMSRPPGSRCRRPTGFRAA